MLQQGLARGAVHPPQGHGVGRVPVPQEIALRATQPDSYPRPVLGSRAVRQARLSELVTAERASTPVGAAKRAGGSDPESITHNLGRPCPRNRRPVAPQSPIGPVEVVRGAARRIRGAGDRDVGDARGPDGAGTVGHRAGLPGRVGLHRHAVGRARGEAGAEGERAAGADAEVIAAVILQHDRAGQPRDRTADRVGAAASRCR